VTTYVGILPMTDSPPRPERALNAVPAAVRAAQRGDAAAFEALYREHAGRVHGLCLRMTGSAQEAEALTQEAFVRAWQRLGGFRGDAAFGTWLHHVAVSVVLTSRRAALRRLRRIETTDDLARVDGPDPTPPAPDARVDLDRAIALLPEGARMVFVLFEIEGHSHAEIARELGIAENTSKAQLHRARGLLRGMLHDGA
jgi:RNA polymerase sigma-70 factor (ECF subfamily)